MRRLFFAFIAMILTTTIAAPLSCKASAKFEVASIDVTPPAVTIGETATVTIWVKNVGGSEGVYTATLVIDSVNVETKSIAVAPATAKAVAFSITKDKTGTYQVAVGGLNSSLVVKEKPSVLEQLKVAYPELYQELVKLPDLQKMDDKTKAAMEAIASLALDKQYKAAFDSMLSEGIKDKRKYCTPLQALLWIAYDGKIDADHLLKAYSLNVLLHDAWTNTATSNSYRSSRWEDFDEVVDRLNSPGLISVYTGANIKYQEEAVNEYVPARLVFERKVDDCDGFATFQSYLLRANGYEAWNVGLAIGTPTGHNVCGYIKDGSYWVLDVGGRMKGPFRSLDELADSYIPRAAIVLFNPFDITSPITGSAFVLPHTVYRP